MSHTRVKTTYSVEGAYGSTETITLYCNHNHSSDITTFYDEDGSVTIMCFGEWQTGNDLWDAMNRLWHPYKGEWGRSELSEQVKRLNLYSSNYRIAKKYGQIQETSEPIIFFFEK